MSNPQTVTPPWLREDLEDVQPLNDNPIPSSSAGSTAATSGKIEGIRRMLQERKTKVVYWMLKFVTMFLCVLIAATAVIGIESINGVETSGKIFVATYMLFFSSLLFMFELMDIRPIEWVDHMLRRNFGFLYGTMGKSLFIIFIAFLCFGLGDPQSLTFATGTSAAMFGILEFALYLKYPEMFEE
mmetsp:Transcript_10904/g.17757  ORF Transcript_10904/g.17757 Transcript_10904/m.17757 type:complete len:185 (-) Transcript_10904:873-1427(-)|eukprot:CAMPEP_0174966108 /NCGR_PEP_ID=MMETSP0004_2-20121128/6804_1 /TAXON_ID=420556 /ORGANISM="Ochromonas sp., Strain CCMP1393" /LENGTH=184 /DNA_ID=CAMNT_0016215011 /DNA_START=71 /DNA_END=625 /DNA_ORIENTATION=-